MHIGLFSPSWPYTESTNGIVNYVHLLRQELLAQGHRVTVFTNHIGTSSHDLNINEVKATTWSKLKQRLFSLFGYESRHVFGWGNAIAATISQAHLDDPLDLLEMEESFGWCAMVQKALPIPVVVKLHGPSFLTLNEDERSSQFSKEKMMREGKALRRIGAIISPSAGTLKATSDHYELNPPIKETIPNPVMLNDDLPQWKIESCDRNTLIFIGRFDKAKGGDVALKVFHQLFKRFPKLRLIFVGPDSGLIAPGGERIHFEAYCHSLFDSATRSQIEYLGKLPHSQLHGLRNQAVATLVVSRWENQPNTALEAMIQGCPVIGFSNGGMSEVIDHGVSGLLAEAGNIDAICQLATEIIENPDLARSIGQKAFETVKARHSPHRVVTKTLDIYRLAIEQRLR